MEIGLVQCVNKGMQRDHSMDKASGEFAFENRNIRITSSGNNSFLSITNEKSTERIPIIITPKENNILYYNLDLEYVGDYIINAKILFENNLNADLYLTVQYLAKGGITDSFRFEEILIREGTKEFYIVKDKNDSEIKSIKIKKSSKSGYFPLTKEEEIPDEHNIGTVLGTATISDKLVIFTKYSKEVDAIISGKIIKDDKNKETFYGVYLFYGDLNFKYDKPIECITSYEGDNVLKVYWVDGVNQPRYINILSDKIYYDNSYFDFVPSIGDSLDVNITKKYEGAGNFKSGIIQYYITYYKKFGAESNTVYQSSLYYISPEDRGGKVDEIQNCSFNINVKPKNGNFDYVRVYSIIRTSLNSTPQVSIVGEAEVIPINKNDKSKGYKDILIIDTNTNNISISPTDIMFLGGNTITASTIEQKDNTLFLGNINSSVPISEGIKELKTTFEEYRNKTKSGYLQLNYNYKSEDETYLDNFIGFNYKALNFYKGNNQYDYPYFYNYPLSYVKYFKPNEVYRIGLQFQSTTGEWSSTVWLQDITNKELFPYYSDDKISNNEEFNKDIRVLIESGDASIVLPYIQFNPSANNLNIDFSKIKDEGFVNYRLVMAEPTYSDRKILSQGYVTPTIFRLGQRINGTSYSQPSWYVRPIIGNKCKHLDNINEVLKDEVEGVLYPGFNSELAVPLKENYAEIAAVELKYPPEKPRYVLREIGIKTEVTSHFNWGIATYSYKIYAKFGITEVINDVEGDIVYTKYVPLTKSISAATQKLVYSKSLNSFLELKYNDSILEAIQDIFPEADYEILGITEGSLIFKGPGEYFVSMQNAKKEKIVQTAGATIYKFLEPVLYVDKINEDDLLLYLPPAIFVSRMTSEKKLQRFGAGYSELEKAKDYFSENFFLDATNIAFYSPNLENINTNLEGLKFRIVGKTNIIKNTSDYKVNISSTASSGGLTDKILNYNLNNYFDEDGSLIGLKSYPLLYDDTKDQLYTINTWNISENINSDYDDENGTSSKIENKIFSNLWFSDYPTYKFGIITDDNNLLEGPIKWEHPYTLTDIKYTEDKESIVFDDLSIYKKSVEDLLFYDSYTSYLGDISEYATTKSIIENNLNYSLRSNRSINIKYNSTDHVVFKLPDISGQMCPLPGYANPRLEKNNYVVRLWDDSIYPKFQQTTVLECTLGERLELGSGVVSYGSYEYKDKIYTMDKSNATEKFIGLKVGDVKLVKVRNLSINGPTIEFTFTGEVIELLDTNGKLANIVKFKDLEVGNFTYNKDGISYYNYGIKYLNDKEILKGMISNDILVQSPFSYLSGHTADSHGNDAGASLLLKFGKDKNDKWITDTSLLDSWLPNNPNGDTEKVYDTLESMNTYGSLDNSLWIGELYRDITSFSPYGGTSENSLELNTFIPISDATPIGEVIHGIEGDTYFQRWDSLRIYPRSEEAEQSVVDVVSVILETHENLDGRSDITRGRDDIINIRKENIDTINDVYSQSNNYITSSILDDKFEDTTHPSLYTWSLTKQEMGDIDNWTSINLINSNRLDGDKGVLTKLKRWNNSLLAFQEKAIAVINFNQQTTLSTDEGVPIEIANSGKVTGHYYISSNQGCKNKWSITDSPYGIYFIDGYNKSINLFNTDGIKSLSTNNLFQDWTVKNENGTVWTPKNNDGFKALYDPIHKEVYFVNNKEALCYNELLNQFTSFYDYGGLSYLNPINEYIYGIKGNYIYKMFEGEDYCKLFENTCNYSITYKVNKDPFIDKIWTNVEYRADIFNSGNISENNASKLDNETFNTIEVWNEYQKGKANLKNKKYPNAKSKFRIWGVDIPRDSLSKLKQDRIRNPWIMLKLEKTTNTNKRMEFHDLIVKYLK